MAFVVGVRSLVLLLLCAVVLGEEGESAVSRSLRQSSSSAIVAEERTFLSRRPVRTCGFFHCS